MNAIEKVGSYAVLMKRTFGLPDRWRMFFRQFLDEIQKQGLDSLAITIIISVFIGAVITIQMVLNTSNPLLPDYATGLAVRDTLLLEFSSSILCLILAGKVGSSISSEIGTMRITEQIDALDIMGVNSANYLIFPKITAFMTIIPVWLLPVCSSEFLEVIQWPISRISLLYMSMFMEFSSCLFRSTLLIQ